MPIQHYMWNQNGKANYKRKLEWSAIKNGMTYAFHHTSASSQQWRVFNWKNLVRLFFTPKIQSKRLSTPQPCWRQCGSLNAHHTQIFWSWEKLKLDKSLDIIKEIWTMEKNDWCATSEGRKDGRSGHFIKGNYKDTDMLYVSIM